MTARAAEPRNHPHVTVATPVHNRSVSLELCSQFAMQPTSRDIEILVAGDASTDSSAAQAERLAAVDSDVGGLRLPENGGTPSTMNKLAEAATGKRIAVLDADDAFHDGRLGHPLKTSCAARRRTGPSWPGLAWPTRTCGRPDIMRVAIALCLLTPMGVHAAPLPPVGDETACQAAIQGVERAARLPPALLSAIARTESGRVLPGGRVVAWPWTINVAGTGYYYGSADQAAAAVETFRTSGIQSIDVGCMQVNLMHHPSAFASLQQAFDPAANVRYAAQFLGRLQAELGTWPAAVGAYHSRTPDLADEYGRRVMQAWPLAAAYGGTAGVQVAALSRPPVIDRYGVYTPEFARRVAADTAARNARERLHPLVAAPQMASTLAQRFPSQLRVPGRRAATMRFAQADLAALTLRRP